MPLSLKDALTTLTKLDLLDICANLDVKGVTSLKKQTVIDCLLEVIPARIHKIFNLFDDDRYAVFKRMVTNGGQASVALASHQYDYFKRRGLAFTGTVGGKGVLVMPSEVSQGFNEIDTADYRREVHRQTEWIQLSHGLLYYFGVLSVADLTDFVAQHTNAKVDIKLYLDVLYDATAYYGQVRLEPEGVVHQRVSNPVQVIREHLMRRSVPYYPFTRAQLLKASKPDFVDRHPAYLALVNYLARSQSIARSVADAAAEHCLHAVQMGDSPASVIQYVSEQFVLDGMQMVETLMYYVTEMYSDSRQWFLKGYSPNELSKRVLVKEGRRKGSTSSQAQVVEFSTKKRVGRNDPCPCGSGKKFKKCCGR